MPRYRTPRPRYNNRTKSSRKSCPEPRFQFGTREPRRTTGWGSAAYRARRLRIKEISGGKPKPTGKGIKFSQFFNTTSKQTSTPNRFGLNVKPHARQHSYGAITKRAKEGHDQKDDNGQIQLSDR